MRGDKFTQAQDRNLGVKHWRKPSELAAALESGEIKPPAGHTYAMPTLEAVDSVLKCASRCYDILTHPEMYGPIEIESDAADLKAALERCHEEANRAR